MLSRLMTVREQWLLLGVAGAIVLGAGVLIWQGNRSTLPAEDTVVTRPVRASYGETIASLPEAQPPTPPTPAIEQVPPEKIAVGILGAVRKPGLYYFPPGKRILDLLRMAGGPLPDSDFSDINRTAVLIDETTLLVPEWIHDKNGTYSYPAVTYNPAPYTRSSWYHIDNRPTAPGSTSAPHVSDYSPSVAGTPVNINSASQSELETLPGIGPVTAQKIIVHRENSPFRTTGDLEQVSGIGPAKMAAVAPFITVE